MSTEPRKRGRQAEAERNNVRILDAAREVFIANPAAPISEVALRAGVGIAALYLSVRYVLKHRPAMPEKTDAPAATGAPR